MPSMQQILFRVIRDAANLRLALSTPSIHSTAVHVGAPTHDTLECSVHMYRYYRYYVLRTNTGISPRYAIQ